MDRGMQPNIARISKYCPIVALTKVYIYFVSLSHLRSPLNALRSFIVIIFYSGQLQLLPAAMDCLLQPIS